MQKYILIILAALLLHACGGSKKMGKEKIKMNADGLSSLLKMGGVQADWLSAKAKINYDDGSFSIGASSTIKMKKDDFIWISVKKFGFEAGRALIRPDSVFVINRLERTYTAEGLDYLEKSFNLPADFNTVQQMLLGNAVVLLDAPFEMQKASNSYHLFHENGVMKNHYYLNNTDLSLSKMEINDTQANRALSIDYAGYKEVNDQNFSYLRDIGVCEDRHGNMDVKIEFTSVQLNEPVEAKFSIPPSYKPM